MRQGLGLCLTNMACITSSPAAHHSSCREKQRLALSVCMAMSTSGLSIRAGAALNQSVSCMGSKLGSVFCAHLLSLLSHAEVTTTASHRPKQTLVQPRLQLPGLCFCSSGTRTPAADVWRCAWHKLPAVPIESKGPWGDPNYPHRTCDTGRGDSTSEWATWYTRPSHLVGHAACTLTDMALTRLSQNVKG